MNVDKIIRDANQRRLDKRNALRLKIVAILPRALLETWIDTYSYASSGWDRATLNKHIVEICWSDCEYEIFKFLEDAKDDPIT